MVRDDCVRLRKRAVQLVRRQLRKYHRRGMRVFCSKIRGRRCRGRSRRWRVEPPLEKMHFSSGGRRCGSVGVGMRALDRRLNLSR